MNEREGLLVEKDGARLFNFRPMFFSALFLAFGILFGYFQKINGVSAWWLFLLLPVLILPFFFCKRLENTLLAVMVLLLFFALGNILFSLAYANFESAVLYEGETTVLGRVVEIQNKGDYVRVVLDRLYLNENESKFKLVAYLPATYEGNIRLADEVVLTGILQGNEGYSVLTGISGGDIADGVKYSVFYPSDFTVIGNSFDLFLYIRQSMVDGIRLGMDETSAGLMQAILLGDTSKVSGVTLQNVRLGGIAHVFAVSGLHIGALYAFCRFVAEKGKFPKWLAFSFTFALVITYGGICGFSSSVLRAIITCLCFYLAKEIGIKADFMEIIGVAAIVVLLLFPTLLFDVGFQLSYGACIGLSCFSKQIITALDGLVFTISCIGKSKEKKREVLEKKENSPPSVWGKLKNSLLGAVGATLAAQTFTLPVLINTFGYISLLSVPLNCIVAPILVAAFPIFLGLAVIACLLSFASVYLLYLPMVVWHALILPFEVINLSNTAWTGSMSGGAITLYLAGAILLSGKINLKGWKKWSAVALYCVLFVVAMIVGNL